MQIIPLNGSEAQYLELFRIALSEPTHAQRLDAIQTIELLMQSDLISMRVDAMGRRGWGPEHLQELIAIAESEPARLDAAGKYQLLLQRFKGRNGLGNERKLNIAELIGNKVLLTIREKRFVGVHTETRILEQVRQKAIDFDVRGAVDDDTLRMIWRTYRGDVHLGMAMDRAEDDPDRGLDVLRLAERIRLELAGHCPCGRKEPYVDPAEQISFRSVPDPQDPRFTNRGVPQGPIASQVTRCNRTQQKEDLRCPTFLKTTEAICRAIPSSRSLAIATSSPNGVTRCGGRPSTGLVARSSIGAWI